jgi:hypothetical protein
MRIEKAQVLKVSGRFLLTLLVTLNTLPRVAIRN